MRSHINIKLPGNINCVEMGGGSIKLSATTFLPKGYETDLAVNYSNGKARKRYVRTEFAIPINTPVCELWYKAETAYQQATKKLRVDIAKFKLREQKRHLARLESL